MADDIERRMFASVAGGPLSAPAPTVESSSLTALTIRLRQLEDENAALRATVAKCGCDSSVPGRRLRDDGDEVRVLQERLADIERFFLEYGLVWVGGGAPGSQLERAPDVDIDFPLLKLRLQQLNDLVGAGEARVVAVNGVHKLEIPKELPLTLYKNGLLVGDRGIRRYVDSEGRAFVQDVLDGYFPEELRPDFPEGVPFTVIDKTSEAVATEDAPAPRGWGAAAMPVGGGDSGNSLEARLRRLARLGSGALPFTSAKQLLGALPSRVVAANGSVVDVRDNIAQLLAGAAEPAAPAAPPPDGGCSVQVRSPDGQSVTLQMPKGSTVGDVRAALAARGVDTAGAELRTAFPRRAVLADDLQTLDALHLVPRGLLHLERKREAAAAPAPAAASIAAAPGR